MAPPFCFYLVAALMALSMSSPPTVRASSSTRRYYSCTDLAGAKLQVKLEVLRANEEAIVSLSNEYLNTSLPDSPWDLRLLRAFKRLKQRRNRHDDIGALVANITVDLNEQTQTLVQACNGNGLLLNGSL
ncbi:uncharacterized protein LOC119726266 [Patiria miniata]|uniref:Uncharacterized protein n=1 Tax=Patiria miniata TaxID=46514 RepID=A0A913ZR23_PATMI|nr:uncharacterized protein LOC119726266 [Patiria miniata]